MAKGQFERSKVQDPNQRTGANAPSQLLAVPGIMRPTSAPNTPEDRGLTEAVNKLGVLSDTVQRKKTNSDYLAGRMAAMSGKTQDEIAETGNRTTMAGFVSVQVGNAVAEWSRTQQEQAATHHYGTDPAAYQKQMADSAADLIAQMGGDEFAEETLMKALEPEMARVTATQAAQHLSYTETETMNAYTQSLITSGQYAAQQYTGAETEAAGPSMGAISGNSDYRSVVAGFVDRIIKVESNGNPNAKNPKSSAEGLGQFIDSTWLAMIAKYRPDLAGKTRAEKLALKFNPTISRQMTEAYGSENAAGLASSGLKVTSGTVYLAHFAGLGGARKVLKGDPTAPVSTTLTSGQIKSNKSIMYKNGRMISNAELVAWAERKMGGKKAAAPNVQAGILRNPGLPPEKHRMAVTQALVSTLSAGDASLWQNVGGMDGLAPLNLSVAQTTQIQRAVKGLEVKRQSEYNMGYEKEKDDLLKKAQSGDFDRDAIFVELAELQTKYSRTDAENKRTHGLIQKSLDAANATEAAGVWAEPDNQFQLFEIQQQVIDGVLTPEEAMNDIVELGAMLGSDEAGTQKQVAVLLQHAAKVASAERREVEKAVTAGEKVAQERLAVEDLISRNILGTGTKAQQEMGVAMLEKLLIEDLQESGVSREDMPSAANDMMAKVLVHNDVVDTRRASMMRAAMANPMNDNGEPTNNAVEAMAFFMDLKHGANASPEYLTKMFAGNEKTLEMLLTAEEHMVGDADLETSIAKAWKQVTDPVTQKRIADTNKRIDSGDFQEEVKTAVLEQSALANTKWNKFMNVLNPDWDSVKLDEEATERLMADSGLDLVIEAEVRSAAALYPQASSETIAKIVAGQMSERGSIVGNSFVLAPKGSSIQKVMGLRDSAEEAPSLALIEYVKEHGEQLFGPDVWKDMNNKGVTGFLTKGMAMKDNIFSPELHVELVGDNFVISPASSQYQFDDDIFFDDYASLPEASTAIIPARDIGRFYNQSQTSGGSVLNPIIDFFRGVQPVQEIDGLDENGNLPPVPKDLQDEVSGMLGNK